MSGAEAGCCAFFQLLAKVGDLEILKVQPNCFLTEAKIRVIPDWLLRYRDGREVYADYKGFDTQSWGRNKKLWKFYGRQPLEVWRQKNGRFFLSETIPGGMCEN